MRLLFATSIVPDGSLGSGYEIANEAIIDALRRAGASVTVIGFAWPGRRPTNPRETVVLGELDVRTQTATPLRKVGWLARAWSDGLTFSSAKLRCVDEAELERALALSGPFDAHVLNSVQFAGAFERLLTARPYLFVAHNAEAHTALENAQTAQSAFQRMLFTREARLLNHLERRLCNGARHVFTLSEEDRTTLGVASPDRSTAVPLVASIAPPEPPSLRMTEYEAALIGTWTWQPNRVGLDWFLGEVVPHLPAGFRVQIAGSLPDDVRAPSPNIRLVGRVPDARYFLRAAAVIPLVSRAGSGVQLKTIETFEMGLPAVATTSALRGIGHLPANCRVADDPAEFARALVATVETGTPDLDGRAFHAAQREALDAAVARGLDALATGRAEVAA